MTYFSILQSSQRALIVLCRNCVVIGPRQKNSGCVAKPTVPNLIAELPTLSILGYPVQTFLFASRNLGQWSGGSPTSVLYLDSLRSPF
jgi:hypothetical protein